MDGMLRLCGYWKLCDRRIIMAKSGDILMVGWTVGMVDLKRFCTIFYMYFCTGFSWTVGSKSVISFLLIYRM